MEGKESLKRLFDQLTDEQKEKVRNCKSMDEIKNLIDGEKIELDEEQLDFLSSGGCTPCDPHCREDCWIMLDC